MPGQLLQGDCRDLLKTLPDASVDAVVTDPPAGIEFMGKDWDNPEKFGTTFQAHGYSDGADRVSAPAQRLSVRNPNCKKCRKHIRGTDGCKCEEPESDEDSAFFHRQRIRQRDGFVAFMQGVMAECFRVLKPGGHALVWALPRTSHWTALAIEDAGFEIRDCVYHVFGSGFPKSLNISKALDKMAGAEREVVKPGKGFDPEKHKEGQFTSIRPSNVGVNTAAFIARIGEVTAPATPEAKEWDGWGTALKPAVECWWLVRKPIEAQNVATQVLKTGTGALNIDGTRVGSSKEIPGGLGGAFGQHGIYGNAKGQSAESTGMNPHVGRWPANLVLSHSPSCRRVGTQTVEAPVINRFTDGMKPFGEGAGHPYETTGGGTEERAVYECVPGCPIQAMDEQSGSTLSTGGRTRNITPSGVYGSGQGLGTSSANVDPATFRGDPGYGDTGGAARFFQNFEPEYDVPFIYTGKASKADKNEGLDEFAVKAPSAESAFSVICAKCNRQRVNISGACSCPDPEWVRQTRKPVANTHPTVKSQALMSYLVRLVTPPGGTVLDPFAGSGSTLVAAINEGFSYIGFEREAEYFKIASQRVTTAQAKYDEEKGQRDLFDLMDSLSE